MRLLVSCSITAVIAYSLGYFLSPYVTSPPEFPWQEKSPDKQVSRPQGDLNYPSKNVLSASANEQSKSEDVNDSDAMKAISSLESDQMDSQNAAQEENSHSNAESMSITEQATLLTEDELVLSDWASEHRSKVSDLIEAHASPQLSGYMVEKMKEANSFVSQPELKQPLAEDEGWAFNMEQELRQFIASHETTESFELLNLSCKQLVCDILGRDSGGHSWQKLYIAILTKVPTVELPNPNINPPKMLNYLDGDIAMIYAQIRFKPN